MRSPRIQTTNLGVRGSNPFGRAIFPIDIVGFYFGCCGGLLFNAPPCKHYVSKLQCNSWCSGEVFAYCQVGEMHLS
jgi:hypothetical protein